MPQGSLHNLLEHLSQIDVSARAEADVREALDNYRLARMATRPLPVREWRGILLCLRDLVEVMPDDVPAGLKRLLDTVLLDEIAGRPHRIRPDRAGAMAAADHPSRPSPG